MWLEKLEEKMAERFGDFAEEYDDLVKVPEIWVKYPWCYMGYGPRDACVRDEGPFRTDELLLDIGWMFRMLLDLVATETVQGAFSICDPSYEDTSIAVIIASDHKHVLYYDCRKAWHFVFETPKDLEDEMVEIAAMILVRREEFGMPIGSVA